MKAKKIQKEEEWKYEVMTNNLILLRHLTEIASSKRVPDGNKKKVNFLTIFFASQNYSIFQKLHCFKLLIDLNLHNKKGPNLDLGQIQRLKILNVTKVTNQLSKFWF